LLYSFCAKSVEQYLERCHELITVWYLVLLLLLTIYRINALPGYTAYPSPQMIQKRLPVFSRSRAAKKGSYPILHNFQPHRKETVEYAEQAGPDPIMQLPLRKHVQSEVPTDVYPSSDSS